jgi:hypothetical protein
MKKAFAVFVSALMVRIPTGLTIDSDSGLTTYSGEV